MRRRATPANQQSACYITVKNKYIVHNVRFSPQRTYWAGYTPPMHAFTIWGIVYGILKDL